MIDEHQPDGRRFIVQWGSKASRQQRSFSGTPQGRSEAIAFAEAYEAEMRKPKTPDAPPALTTAELWRLYSEATFPHLRPRSRKLYAENWKRWESYFTRERLADSMTLTDATGFRADLERAGLATKTIQSAIEQARAVYNWAERAELIGRNRWHQFQFKVAKEKRTQPRAEYRQADFLAIWRQFDPTRAGQWRPYVAVGLLGLYGSRQNAILHLTWDDVNEGAGTLTLRPEWDKQGEEHVHALLPLTRELVAVAKAWRERDDYTGPWLLYPARKNSGSDTYTIQSLWSALEEAEKRAGIAKVRYRAGHGFRRGLVGDLLEAGNDMDLALKAIGDRDLRMAKHYAVKRNDRIEKALAARADGFAGVTKGQPAPENANADHSGESGQHIANDEPSTT
ncbi:MAG: tyrosine-type recombinase/integrase [Gemmatimonas sp.]|nr:tyrosine-type recombinase/integrase [Gemmatimonas sp.]